MKIRLIFSVSVLFSLLGVGASPAYASPIETLSRKYEEFLLGRLAQSQKPPARLAPFATDGCSGGMSEGWRVLAETLPKFAEGYGEKPPWEHCCVAHDRHYWRGEVENGYEKRLQADLELKQCVIETGTTAKIQLVTTGYKLSRQEIEETFSVAADLMYVAVRAGGQPCSLFPWRWGYGWPMCPVFESDEVPPESHPAKNHRQEI